MYNQYRIFVKYTFNCVKTILKQLYFLKLKMYIMYLYEVY